MSRKVPHTIIFYFDRNEVIWKNKGRDVRGKFEGLRRDVWEVTVCPGNFRLETVAYPTVSNSLRYIKQWGNFEP